MKKQIDLAFWIAVLVLVSSARSSEELLVLAPSTALLGGVLSWAAGGLRLFLPKPLVYIWIFLILMLAARAVAGFFGTPPYWPAALLIMMLQSSRGKHTGAGTRCFRWAAASTLFAELLVIPGLLVHTAWPFRPSLILAALAILAGVWDGWITRTIPFLKERQA